MSRYTELTARAEHHLAVAEAGADDPHVAALCAMATAVLAQRPALRLGDYLTITEGDESPTALAARAVAAAFEAAATELDQLDVDDCGFPTHALS